MQTMLTNHFAIKVPRIGFLGFAASDYCIEASAYFWCDKMRPSQVLDQDSESAIEMEKLVDRRGMYASRGAHEIH